MKALIQSALSAFGYRITRNPKSFGIIDLLGNSGKFPSRKEAKRLLQQGAVKIDGEKANIGQLIEKPEGEMIVQAGKRLFFKLLA